MIYHITDSSSRNPVEYSTPGDLNSFFCPHCDSKVPIVRICHGRYTGKCECPGCRKTYTISR